MQNMGQLFIQTLIDLEKNVSWANAKNMIRKKDY